MSMFRRVFHFFGVPVKDPPRMKFKVHVPGTHPDEYVYTNDPEEAKLLEQGFFYRSDGKVACTVCGGNCGQCGNTARLGNIGFSMERIAGNLNQSRKKRK